MQHHPASYHNNSQFASGYHQPHPTYAAQSFPTNQLGQYPGFDQNQGVIPQVPYHSDPNSYQQFTYSEGHDHYNQYQQGREADYHQQQQPKPLLQTEISVSSLPSHVVQTETGWFIICSFDCNYE